MSNYTGSARKNLHRLRQVEVLLPFKNPTLLNPDYEDASYRLLIVRLSPFRDVDRSIPHLFLFQEARRALPNAFIDVAFFPPKTDRALFDEEGIPYLLGTQSLRSIDEFDLVLISNAYTLELINLPYLMIRSNVPLLASRRGPEWPILILGGSNAMAAQAVIRPDGDSLVDGIFFGEGEDSVGRLVAALAEKRSGKLQGLQLDGLWTAGEMRPTRKAVCTMPGAWSLPTEYPLLNSPEVHTANLQITYGCPAFCSFCFEGWERKPYREMPLSELVFAAREIKRAQGNEELSLHSFNFNTHQDILALLLELHRLFERVSVKSQRVDVLQHARYLLEAELEAGKRSFTLGIEGISERQRALLHKSLSTADIVALLTRLFAHKIREVKLFYLLTGHETDDDIAEFRQFVKQLKEMRRSQGAARSGRGRARVVFSFGLLIRMPFTPLQYDRLFLDRATWRPLIGQVKSACETNGFEFRLAFDWQAYCVTQTLALGGYWMLDAITALAEKGYCFDTELPPGYWDELWQWMRDRGHWNDAFLGEKEPGYPFALDFVESSVSSDFLFRQYQEAKAGMDGGYCLGSYDHVGRCLGCGACVDASQREAITRHQTRLPPGTGDGAAYLNSLKQVITQKRHLGTLHVVVRLDPVLGGVVPAFANASVFRGILAEHPELLENLLSVRESLFTVRPNDRQFPPMSGETVFALKAWDLEAVRQALMGPKRQSTGGFQVVRLAEDFVPGRFATMHLELHLPGEHFAEPRRRLEDYLRDAYVPYSLRREGADRSRYRFHVPPKGMKKKIVLGGTFEVRGEGFCAGLNVGPKFDAMRFMEEFGTPGLYRHARLRVSDLQW